MQHTTQRMLVSSSPDFHLMERNIWQNYTAAALSAICKEREENTHSNLQLSKMFEVSNIVELWDLRLTHPTVQANASYRAENVGGVWRLINRPEGSPDDEEVVVSFQGILYKTDLPPFSEKNMWVFYISILQQFIDLHATDQTARWSTFDKVLHSPHSETQNSTTFSLTSHLYIQYSGEPSVINL